MQGLEGETDRERCWEPEALTGIRRSAGAGDGFGDREVCQIAEIGTGVMSGGGDRDREGSRGRRSYRVRKGCRGLCIIGGAL